MTTYQESQPPMTSQRMTHQRGEKIPNSIYVGPGSPWANPFQPSRTELKNNTGTFICETPQGWFEASPADFRHPPEHSIIRRPTPMESLILFTEWMGAGPHHLRRPMSSHVTDQWATVKTALAGHHLTCWHREDEPCHADVLIDLAN